MNATTHLAILKSRKRSVEICDKLASLSRGFDQEFHGLNFSKVCIRFKDFRSRWLWCEANALKARKRLAEMDFETTLIQLGRDNP